MVSCGVLVGLALVACFAIAEAKVFTKCELAKELYRLGIPKTDLPDWVCLAQYESSFNTALVHTNTGGTKDWGLFQINDRYWCNPGDGRQSSNLCNVACSALKTDDISKALTCAIKIKTDSKGFKAWVAWNNNCQTKKASVSECF